MVSFYLTYKKKTYRNKENVVSNNKYSTCKILDYKQLYVALLQSVIECRENTVIIINFTKINFFFVIR